jgi:hypothetical protein
VYTATEEGGELVAEIAQEHTCLSGGLAKDNLGDVLQHISDWIDKHLFGFGTDFFLQNNADQIEKGFSNGQNYEPVQHPICWSLNSQGIH